MRLLLLYLDLCSYGDYCLCVFLSVYSLKKLKSKEERKLWRTQKREHASNTKNEKSNFKIGDETEKGAEGTKQCKFT